MREVNLPVPPLMCSAPKENNNRGLISGIQLTTGAGASRKVDPGDERRDDLWGWIVR